MDLYCVVVTCTRCEETIVLPSCVHVTLGAGSPSISQTNRAESPLDTVKDCGFVSILAETVALAFLVTTDVVDSFTLVSDDTCFSDVILSEEEYEADDKYSVDAYLIGDAASFWDSYFSKADTSCLSVSLVLVSLISRRVCEAEDALMDVVW